MYSESFLGARTFGQRGEEGKKETPNRSRLLLGDEDKASVPSHGKKLPRSTCGGAIFFEPANS